MLEQFKLKTIEDADFYYIPKIYPFDIDDGIYAKKALSWLVDNIDWREEFVTFYGKSVKMPRLIRFFGSKPYTYSGVTHPAVEMPDTVDYLRQKVEEALFNLVEFNSVLLNYYRDGNDSISWHSDDESALGKNSKIASLSLGTGRVFKLRHKKTKVVTDLLLEDGSLLLMGDGSQDLYQHCILKSKTHCGKRVNLTFRKTLKEKYV